MLVLESTTMKTGTRSRTSEIDHANNREKKNANSKADHERDTEEVNKNQEQARNYDMPVRVYNYSQPQQGMALWKPTASGLAEAKRAEQGVEPSNALEWNIFLCIFIMMTD